MTPLRYASATARWSPRSSVATASGVRKTTRVRAGSGPTANGAAPGASTVRLAPLAAIRAASAARLVDFGSIPVEARRSLAVPRRIAERRLGDPRPLEEEADVVLVGDADAAVHLHALVRHEHERVGAAR